jgi:diguanylate cyclase
MMFYPGFLYLLIVVILLCVNIAALLFVLRYFIRLSEKDETTSLMNYRGFRREIRKIISKHKAKGTSFTLAIFDIDNFKKFNDQSYAFGDSVLKQYARFLKDNLPQDALIARFRFGDEFIIVLNSDLSVARQTINDIQNKCCENDFFDKQNVKSFRVSFSYGFASFEKTDTAESLLLRIEKDLKEKKQTFHME